MKPTITYADLACVIDRPWAIDCWAGPGTDLLTYETSGYLIVADDYSDEAGDLTLSVYRLETDVSEDAPLDCLTLRIGGDHESEAAQVAAYDEAMSQARIFIERYESQPTETVSVYWTVTAAYEIHELEVPVGATNQEIMDLVDEEGGGFCSGAEEVHTHAISVERAEEAHNG